MSFPSISHFKHRSFFSTFEKFNTLTIFLSTVYPFIILLQCTARAEVSQPCLKNTYMHCKENACSTQVKLIFMCEYKDNKLSRRCKVTLGTKIMVLNVLTVMDTPQLGHRLLNPVTVTVITIKKALEWNFPMIFVINRNYVWVLS